MDFEKLVEKAKKTNAKRDADDRKFGFAPPKECPIDVHISTALEAVKAGIITQDWGTVAEGWAILEEVLERIPRTKA